MTGCSISKQIERPSIETNWDEMLGYLWVKPHYGVEEGVAYRLYKFRDLEDDMEYLACESYFSFRIENTTDHKKNFDTRFYTVLKRVD